MTTDFERLLHQVQRLSDQTERPRVSELDILIYESAAAAERVLDQALAQLLAGRGRSPDTPLEHLGIEGIHCLLRAVPLEVHMQSATPCQAGILDAMHARGWDEHGAYTVVIFNLVD